jgi:hypothetical protein
MRDDRFDFIMTATSTIRARLKLETWYADERHSMTHLKLSHPHGLDDCTHLHKA